MMVNNNETMHTNGRMFDDGYDDVDQLIHQKSILQLLDRTFITTNVNGMMMMMMMIGDTWLND